MAGGGVAGGGSPDGGGRWLRVVQGRAPGSGRLGAGGRGGQPDDSSGPGASDPHERSDAALRSPRSDDAAPLPATGRRLLTAELLSIGSELTVGETRDTNAGEVARAPHRPRRPGRADHGPPRSSRRGDRGVRLRSRAGGPGRLDRRARTDAGRPDPRGDRGRLRRDRRPWTRDSRPGCASSGGGATMPFPELNLKQAWLDPVRGGAAEPQRDRAGLVRATRPDGAVVVALPGPPREMRPMWPTRSLPRLERGLGADVAVADLSTDRDRRVAGRRPARRAAAPRDRTPSVATYARVEAVDVRISAVGDARTTAEDARGGGRGEVLEARRASTSGRPVTTTWGDGDRRAARRARLDAWPSSRSGRPGSSPRSSATSPGSASARRSPPTPRARCAHRRPRPRLDRPTTSRVTMPTTGPGALEP